MAELKTSVPGPSEHLTQSRRKERSDKRDFLGMVTSRSQKMDGSLLAQGQSRSRRVHAEAQRSKRTWPVPKAASGSL